MIPGLSSGSRATYGNGASPWAASWSAASAPNATEPAQTPQQKLKAAALASRAPGARAQQSTEVYEIEDDDDDDYSPEPHIEEIPIGSGPQTAIDVDDDDEDDIYEPELHTGADAEHALEIDDDDDDMYDPDAYLPEDAITEDISPGSFDTNSQGSKSDAPGKPVKPSSSSDRSSGGHVANQSPVSRGELDAVDSVEHPNCKEDQEILITEARKKAQASILRLWPLEVRFQQYIDEGIAEDVIKSLFSDLGLDISSSQPQKAQDPKPTPSLTTSTVTPETSSRISSHNVSRDPATTDSVSAPTKTQSSTSQVLTTETSKADAQISNPSEERKDRIARLLAMKKASQSQATSETTPIQAPLPPQRSINATTNSVLSLPPKPPASVPTTPLMSKEDLIKQKMEVLAKMRAKKASAITKTSKSSTSNIPHDMESASTSSIPVINSGSKHTYKTPPSNALTCPEAFETATSQTVIPNRPYPNGSKTTAHSIAPTPSSWPIPQPTTLIIDVSSDEDDYTQLRNDIESQHLQSGNTSTNPASSNIRTPGTSSANGTKQVAELDRDINQLKRKIAEMEARKSISGSETPVDQQQMKSPLLALPSYTSRPPAAIPVVAASKVQKRPPPAKKRRARNHKGASRKLPLVEATLAEKIARLQTVNLEAMQLLKEIDDAQREKLRLEQEASSSFAGNSEVDNCSDKEDGEAGETPDSPSIHTPILGKRKQNSPPQLIHSSVYYISGAQNGLPNKPPASSIPEEALPLVNDSVTSPSKEIPVLTDTSSSDNDSSEEEMASDEEDAEIPYAKRVKATAQSDLQDVPAPSLAPCISANDTIPTVDSSSEDSDTSISEDLDDDSESGEEESEVQSKASSTRAVGKAPTARQTDSGNPCSPHVPIWKQKMSQKQQENQATVPPQSLSPSTDHEVGNHSSDGLTQASMPKVTTDISEVIDKVKNPEYPGAFVPYESMYHGNTYYCFHPNFANDVVGGLQSLTYSNNIDPRWAFCTDDLHEGGCPKGNDCEWQHLSNIGIGEDKILVALGNSNGLNHADRRRFIDGLRQVLVDIKVRDIQDFDLISKAILDYRRDFLGDDSKVRFMNVDI
ncbi:uncharacterized protein BROUX77_007258 [Berkeleyomyces rouxiae]|uniref:uncharacterized protein n=1 Tax=Berkeleyomyces rouxiae TaxID=2035830 RepID=UPI003B80DF0C